MPSRSPLLLVSKDLLLPGNKVIHCLFCDWLISLSALASWLICAAAKASALSLPPMPIHLHTSWLECGFYHLTLLNSTSLNTGYEHVFQARLQFFCTFRESGKVESQSTSIFIFFCQTRCFLYQYRCSQLADKNKKADIQCQAWQKSQSLCFSTW